ncbi:MAG: hypothetical protein L3J54_12565, partial [Draconibacterium sp.]|nr:hypothetical protein [Draconibacterium sp.]
MNIKTKIVIKFFFAILFVAYYFSITLFYHSHVINGKKIVHSHFYINTHDTAGNPINHSHSQDEVYSLQIISQFITTFIAAG